MKSTKRAIRRHHIDRLKNKRKTYWGHNPAQPDYNGEQEKPLEGRKLGLVLSAPKPQCQCCRNPRRSGWYSGPGKRTIQERKLIDDSVPILVDTPFENVPESGGGANDERTRT